MEKNCQKRKELCGAAITDEFLKKNSVKRIRSKLNDLSAHLFCEFLSTDRPPPAPDEKHESSPQKQKRMGFHFTNSAPKNQLP